MCVATGLEFRRANLIENVLKHPKLPSRMPSEELLSATHTGTQDVQQFQGLAVRSVDTATPDTNRRRHTRYEGSTTDQEWRRDREYDVMVSNAMCQSLRYNKNCKDKARRTVNELQDEMRVGASREEVWHAIKEGKKQEAWAPQQVRCRGR